MSKKISTVFYRFSLVMLLILVATAAVFSSFKYLNRDKPFINISGSYFIYILSSCVLTGILLYKGYKKITSVKHYFVASGVIFAIMIIVQLYLAQIKINPITDCFTTIDEAIAMLLNQNGIIDNTSEYFERYTNNYFFTIIMYYYFSIVKFFVTDYFYAAVILNILCIDLTVFICFRIVNNLFGRERALGLLYLMALCPTTYVFVSFPYTNTFSAPFVAGVLYFAIKLKQCNGIKNSELIHYVINGMGLAICGAIGTLLRPTTVIAVIAALIYLMMVKTNVRSFFGIVLIVAVLVLLFEGGSVVTKHHIKNKEQEGFPATHWVMMGLNNRGFVSSSDVMYTKSFTTKAEKVNGNMKVIGERLSNLGAGGLLVLYANKIGEVWGVGTDSYNTLNSSSLEFDNRFDMIYGRNCFWLIMYCQAFRAISLYAVLLLIIHMLRKKEINEIFPIALTLLGIMVFLMLWETNRKHNICFLPILIMLEESGFNLLKYITVEKVKKRKSLVLVVGCIFVISDILLIIDKPYFTDIPRIERNNSFYHYENRLEEVNEVFQNGKTVEQYFHTQKPFNTIQVRFRPYDLGTKECSYKMSLFKDDVLQQNVIVKKDNLAEKGWYYMKCDESAGNYSVRIEGVEGDFESMKLLMMGGRQMAPYRNARLEIGDVDTHCSLAFNVYNEENKAFVSESMYILLLSGIIIMQIFAIGLCVRLTQIA